jgi:phage terminase large subunit
LKIETQIKLDRFKPRPYQMRFLDAFENKGFKKLLLIWPRRAGKDICCFNLLLRAALRKVGAYYYLLPTFSQARRVIFDSITNDGNRFLDLIPPELIANINSQEMKIRLTNGSILQLLGSDTYDTSLVGTNPRGIIFSEYALQDSRAFQFARPILASNDGFCVLISTPRGKNSLWELYNIAKANPEHWFVEKLTLHDTNHIPMQEIERERAEGILSEDLIQQEYYTSFELGVEGAYYAKYIDKLHLKGQIGLVPWEAAFPVHTAWDLGVRDSTTIIFFQVIGQIVRCIDVYENSKVGLEHYITVIKQKPYTWGKHIAPHDIKVQELGSGLTRIEKARQLGINFTIAPSISIEDGIECVRSTLGKVWIDTANCKPLIKALENYRQEYDSKLRVYKPRPLHNEHSHFADSMRYLCISLPKTVDGLTADELDRRHRAAMYGEQSNMPSVFRDDLPSY